MAKFNPAKYDAKADSTPFHLRDDVEVPRKSVVLDYRPRPKVEHLKVCACGCKQPVANRKQFKMGHDQRLKGILTRAHLTGTQVTVIFGDAKKAKVHTYSAADHAAQFNTDKQDWVKMLQLAQDRADAEPAPRPAAKRGPSVGSSLAVKIGRWNYDATITKVNRDGTANVQYQTKSGETKTATVEVK